MTRTSSLRSDLQIRQATRVAALALLLVAVFVALTGTANVGGLMATTAILMLVAVRVRRGRVTPRPGVPAAA